MSRFLFALGASLLAAGPCFALAQKPVENKGLVVERVIHSGSEGDKVLKTTIFVRLFNPNEGAVDVRNIRCEFHNDDKLVKQFSIARLTVTPGEGKYEAPQKVDGTFNRALCKLGK